MDQKLHLIKKVLITDIVHLGCNWPGSHYVSSSSILDSQFCGLYAYECPCCGTIMHAVTEEMMAMQPTILKYGSAACVRKIGPEKTD